MSCKKLAKDEVTKEIQTTGFGKEFGNLAQRDNKAGTSGMDAVRFMNLEQIKNILVDRVVTYVRKSGHGFQTAEGRSKPRASHDGGQLNCLLIQTN